MAIDVPFELRLDGGEAQSHALPAYDGYMALAGFALSLSRITHYVETGKIRYRGDFDGRRSVKTYALSEGSVLSKFKVLLPDFLSVGGKTLHPSVAREFLYDVTKRTIDRNLGLAPEAATDELRRLERTKGGDLEALVAAVEPAIRQSHSVIGEGAKVMNIYGGPHQLGSFTSKTKEYVEGSYDDYAERFRDFSVASFNANSGHGGVFDNDLGRVIPFSMNSNTLRRIKSVMSWGLDQYANGTGAVVTLRYTSVLALDDTVKKYVIIDARKAKD